MHHWIYRLNRFCFFLPWGVNRPVPSVKKVRKTKAMPMPTQISMPTLRIRLSNYCAVKKVFCKNYVRKRWKTPQKSKKSQNFRKRPNASNWFRMHPNGSEWIRKPRKARENLKKVAKTSKSLAKTSKNFAKNFTETFSRRSIQPVSYTHLTLPTTPYV